MKKGFLIVVAIVVVVLVVATIGGSFYIIDYALAPDAERTDTAKSFRKLVEKHPEVKPWLDSLNQCGALRDTFIIMPSGEKHHGYFVSQETGVRSQETGDGRKERKSPVAIVVHGWRDNAIKFMMIARIYEQAGCNVLMPELHAHGLSEGEAVQMGWKDRKDVLHWMEVASELFGTNDFIVHGVSMGAATTMCVSGEKMPECVKSVRFIEDCGYTSVWDEFSYELKEEFGLSDFPLLYATSLLCKIKYGWSFGEASPVKQVRKCPYPMLFIHGDNDTFVPSEMVHPLYEAKQGEKAIWITKGTEHARSYTDYREEYTQRVREFIGACSCVPSVASGKAERRPPLTPPRSALPLGLSKNLGGESRGGSDHP